MDFFQAQSRALRASPRIAKDETSIVFLDPEGDYDE